MLNLFKKYLDFNWSSIQEGDSVKLLYNSNGISWYGTSMLNYMQTTMLEILSVVYDEPVSNLRCLKELDISIYQIKTSPNIQSCSVIKTNSNDEDKIKKFELMKDWRWSTEVIENECRILKLVVPSLGFKFPLILYV